MGWLHAPEPQGFETGGRTATEILVDSKARAYETRTGRVAGREARARLTRRIEARATVRTDPACIKSPWDDPEGMRRRIEAGNRREAAIDARDSRWAKIREDKKASEAEDYARIMAELKSRRR